MLNLISEQKIVEKKKPSISIEQKKATYILPTHQVGLVSGLYSNPFLEFSRKKTVSLLEDLQGSMVAIYIQKQF